MLAKSTLIAPAGVSGTIHASHSGKNYDIGVQGTVVVDACDVAALLNAGYQHVPPGADHRVIAPDAPPVTSDATYSQELGASAIDPAKRETMRRKDDEMVQSSQDFGGATPPHGTLGEGVSTEGTKADAKAEVDTAARAGVDPTAAGHIANTGHMGTHAATGADEATARSKAESDEAGKTA